MSRTRTYRTDDSHGIRLVMDSEEVYDLVYIQLEREHKTDLLADLRTQLDMTNAIVRRVEAHLPAGCHYSLAGALIHGPSESITGLGLDEVTEWITSAAEHVALCYANGVPQYA